MLRRFSLLLLALPLAAQEKPARTVWDGVYGAVQADRGLNSYSASCKRCHGEDLVGSGNVLRGARFMDHWREDNLQNLFTILKKTMPRGAPGTLSDGEYVDIIAFVLQANSFPAGGGELTSADLENIRITAKEGPKAVPDFSLITVVGCLVPGSSEGVWMLKAASDPIRTRNPRESTKEEMDEATARPGGQQGFRLLDTRNFPKQTREGRWVEAKGFLIRNPDDNRINLTWLQTLAETCKEKP